MSEMERISDVYHSRDNSDKRHLYAWHLPLVRYQEAIKDRMFAEVLKLAFGEDLSQISVLDVGCGDGNFLRKLIEWGASPDMLIGTEFLENRLLKAQGMTSDQVHYHLGDLEFTKTNGVDLISAHTVFSSILATKEREVLASKMWERVRKGGWIMIFDFRYNNPSNSNVRKVTIRELRKNWPSSNRSILKKGMLVPPLARKLPGSNYAIADFCTLIFPFLRSHFVYMVQKN